ncbi:MAG TPA: SirB2 family protein [Woeseiaceae bacterium]
MLELYPEIKWVHVAAVVASGGLFLLRGLAVQARARWPMAAPVRYLSYAIDIVLLAAALLLLAILPSAVYANGWLAAKLGLLVVYIGLGTFALKRGRTAAVRSATFVGAMLVYGAMFSIARTHHPLGPLLAFLR